MLWRADQHERLTDEAWNEARVRDALGEIVADAEASCVAGFWPGHPLDDLPEQARLCTIYLGSTGVIWALRQLDSSIDWRELIAGLIDRYRASPDFAEDGEAHPPSLWMGETGLLVVAARAGAPVADRLGELVRANRTHPTWDLMWGSPGTMLAAHACGL